MLRLLLLVVLCQFVTVNAWGVEIYRIGGADQPVPDDPGIFFHQLRWSDFDDQAGLDPAGLASDLLRPIHTEADENIALTAVERGGGPWVQVTGESRGVTEHSKTLIDGDYDTIYEWFEVSGHFSGRFLQPHMINVDLGGPFRVDRVRLISPGDGSYPNRFDLFTNPEQALKGVGLWRGVNILTYDLINSVDGDVVTRLSENVQDTIDVHFPAAVAHTVLVLLYRTSPAAVKVNEIEVYGSGYINEAFYVSPLIDLGEPGIWGDIRWRGRQDPQATVWIKTRAGRDLDPNSYWRYTGIGSEISSRDESGQHITEAGYRRLKPGEEAGITYDVENWSFWSAPYDFADSSGTSVLSPAPNSVFQLSVDFFPDASDGASLDFIEFSVTKPPLAEQVIGEIYPPEVALGEVAQFTYAIEPTIRDQNGGFDRIEIQTPFGLVGIDTVKVGRTPVEIVSRIENADSTRFSVDMPNLLTPGDSGTLIEVIFRAPVLRYNTTFSGWVRDTTRPLELPQQVTPGDAALELESEVLSVRTSFSKRLVGDVEVAPRTVTPNGDGVNDVIEFSLTLLQLTSAAPLTLEIFDLSGRKLWAAERLVTQSGRFSFSWDGRDSAGRLVPPGAFIYQLRVESENGDDHASGSLTVAY